MSLGPDGLGGPFQDRELEAFRGAEIVAPFVVADTENGAVGGEEDGCAAGGFGALDDAFL